MTLKIIGIILMMPFIALFARALKENKELRAKWALAAIIIGTMLILVAFIAGLIMLIFG